MSGWMFRRASRGAAAIKKLPWMQAELSSTSNDEDQYYTSSVDSYGHSSEGTSDGAHVFADDRRVADDDNESEASSSFEDLAAHRYPHSRKGVFERSYVRSSARQRIRTPEFPASSRTSSIDSTGQGKNTLAMRALCNLIKNLNSRLSEEGVPVDTAVPRGTDIATEDNEAELMLQSLVNLFTTMQNDRKNFLQELQSLRSQLRSVSAEPPPPPLSDRHSVASSFADEPPITPWLTSTTTRDSVSNFPLAPPPCYDERKGVATAPASLGDEQGAFATSSAPDCAELDAVVDQISQKLNNKKSSAAPPVDRRQQIRREIEALRKQVDLIKGEVQDVNVELSM